MEIIFAVIVFSTILGGIFSSPSKGSESEKKPRIAIILWDEDDNK